MAIKVDPLKVNLPKPPPQNLFDSVKRLTPRVLGQIANRPARPSDKKMNPNVIKVKSWPKAI